MTIDEQSVNKGRKGKSCRELGPFLSTLNHLNKVEKREVQPLGTVSYTVSFVKKGTDVTNQVFVWSEILPYLES